jgi:hypothetical protein
MGSMLAQRSSYQISSFTGSENPISAGGVFFNGLTTGLDWNDLRVTSGLCYGTQDGSFDGTNFRDSLAILNGIWKQTQTVQATVKTVNQNATAFCEVELWTAASCTAHSTYGYECAFRCHASSNPYIGIVRWNGALNDFTPLTGGNISGPGLHDGDTIKVVRTGFTIDAYINGVLIGSRTDDLGRGALFGAPGIGHWWHNNGAVGVNATDYGFTSLTVTAT